MSRKPTTAPTGWPADEVSRRPVASLAPAARNARTHSDEQVGQLADAITKWGWTTPVLIDEEGTIIAGHGRVLAAQRLGIADVPVMIARGWDEQKRRAYMLADNKLALNSGWDTELLRAELTDLMALGQDLQLVGFSSAELAALTATTDGKTDPDAVPKPPDNPVSIAGDVWLLGRHRLACGSCTDAGTVGGVLEGCSPVMMITDPPYGVQYDPTWRHRAGVNKSKRVGAVANDERDDWREAWALFPGAVAYVWHSALHQCAVADSLTAAGFAIRSQIIWAKDRLVMGRGHYHWQHEPCYYAARGTAGWQGDRKQSTLWSIPTRDQDAETIHSTQKPVECMRRPMLNNSQPGDTIYEPFSGSGTTIIAAEMAGRDCRAVELNPVYVDVAIIRWQAFTDGTARLASTGRTFAEVAHARGVVVEAST